METLAINKPLAVLPEGKSHTRLLGELFQAAYAGPNELKGLVEANDSCYRQLGFKYDGKETNLRELLLTTSLESSTLIQTEMNATLIEGAEPFKQVRNAFKIIPMKSKLMQLPKGETGTYAPDIAEGAIIDEKEQDYGSVTFTAKKKGVLIKITDEMIKDSLFDVAAWEVAKAGARLENRLNRDMVDELLSSLAATAGYCTDFGNAGATPLTHIDEAITTIKNNGFVPGRVLFHPSCFSAYRIAMQGLNYDVGVSTNQRLPPVFGLQSFETGIADNAATYVWGWGTDGYLGGYVFDYNSAAAIGMREDVNVNDFKDPIRQITGITATMRYDCQVMQESAGNLLQY